MADAKLADGLAAGVSWSSSWELEARRWCGGTGTMVAAGRCFLGFFAFSCAISWFARPNGGQTSNFGWLTAMGAVVTGLENTPGLGQRNRMSETPVSRTMGDEVCVRLSPVTGGTPEPPFRHAISPGLHCYTIESYQRLGFRRYSPPLIV